MKTGFIGRQQELKKLHMIHKRPSASLVVVRGRRRIGKSRLVTEFAKQYHFIKITGLAPEKNIHAQNQRDNFASKLQEQLNIAKPVANDWENLFLALAQSTQQKNIVILLDEISWMAKGDDTFLPKLKNVWDDYLSENSKITLILCGSVSSWIDKNILCGTGFFGRVIETITLKELSLKESIKLLDSRGFIGSTMEKMMVLALTGGVPWYLEMFDSNTSAKKRICQLCFETEGLLTTEFERIFHDLFGQRSSNYKKIIELIKDKKLNNAMLSKQLNYSNSGALSEYLQDLTVSGFIEKDNAWNIKTGDDGNSNYYRLKDNYLRFYLHYIKPNQQKINRGNFSPEFNQLPQFDTIMGLQFENLVLNNRESIWNVLGINAGDIENDNPYFQKATKNQEGCQIDYLVQTKYNTLFLCEIKFSKSLLKKSIVNEVSDKIIKLKKPKHFSCFPVLIHAGAISESLEAENFFVKIISLQELL